MNTDEGSVRIDPQKDIQVMAGTSEKVRLGWYPTDLLDEGRWWIRHFSS